VKSDEFRQASGPDTENSSPSAPAIVVTHRTVPPSLVNILITGSMVTTILVVGTSWSLPAARTRVVAAGKSRQGSL
jgi:hypothetical protein